MGVPTPVLWDVVEEHLDEAAFLWTQWERALVAPNCTLKGVLRGPEERLLAHVDGLVVAGEPAVERLLVPALEDDEAEKVFAAALAMLDGPMPDAVVRVLTRLSSAEPKVAEAITRALGLAHRPGIERELLALAGSGIPRHVGPALEALTFRRVPVPAGILQASSSEVPAAALRAARFAGPRVLRLIDRGIGSPVVAVRDAAVESGLLLGLRSAWAACQRAVQTKEPGSVFALLVLALSGEPTDTELIIEAVTTQALRPAALFALGFTGRVAAAEVALALLRDEKAARLAAETFSAITGLVIEGEFQAPEPEPQEEPLPLEEEDLDANLVPGSEAALPLPAADAIEAWWTKARTRFDARVRYLSGNPYGAETVRAALAEGPMRRRHVLGLDLAIRSRGEYAIQTRGWAAEQLRFQGEHRVTARQDFAFSFGKLLRE